MTLPCIDCITLPSCISRYIENDKFHHASLDKKHIIRSRLSAKFLNMKGGKKMTDKYFPCKDCITYAICKTEYMITYMKSKEDPRHSELSRLIMARSTIRKKCSIVDEYIKNFKRDYGYRKFYRKFTQIGKDIK